MVQEKIHSFFGLFPESRKPMKVVFFTRGKEFKPENILDANKHNICMIVQEQSTVTTISVAANIFIGKEDMFSKGGVVDRQKNGSRSPKGTG